MRKNGGRNRVNVNDDCLLNEMERGIQYNRNRFDTLSGCTEPRTNAGRVGAGLVIRMVLGMGHAGGNHGPVHQHETGQQQPDEPGLF